MKLMTGLLIVLGLSGCISKSQYQRDLKTTDTNYWEHEERLKALETFMNDAKNREAQTVSYDLEWQEKN